MGLWRSRGAWFRVGPKVRAGGGQLTSRFIVRRATIADVTTIARHRAEMFSDMRTLPRSLYDDMVGQATQYLELRIVTAEYMGRLAARADKPDEIITGAGLLKFRISPHPLDGLEGVSLAEGHRGLIIDVYTERAWRRQGLARLLMEHLMAWAEMSGLETLVLHASDEGRALHERLGFKPTNEMRHHVRSSSFRGGFRVFFQVLTSDNYKSRFFWANSDRP
jgi:GNAT superfamily N-acetyltransferase